MQQHRTFPTVRSEKAVKILDDLAYVTQEKS